MSARNEDWADVARHTRRALALLGYPVPDCLPDEPEACGGTWAEHAAGNLIALRAVVDHQLEHLDPPGHFYAIRDDVLANIRPGCQLREHK